MDTFLASVLVLSLVGREHEQIVKDEDKVQVSGTNPDRKAAAFTPTQMPRFTAGGSPYDCGSFFSRVCVFATGSAVVVCSPFCYAKGLCRFRAK